MTSKMGGSKQWERIQLRKLEWDKVKKKKKRSSEQEEENLEGPPWKPRSGKLQAIESGKNIHCFRTLNGNNAIGAEN